MGACGLAFLSLFQSISLFDTRSPPPPGLYELTLHPPAGERAGGRGTELQLPRGGCVPLVWGLLVHRRTRRSPFASLLALAVLGPHERAAPPAGQAERRPRPRVPLGECCSLEFIGRLLGKTYRRRVAITTSLGINYEMNYNYDTPWA